MQALLKQTTNQVASLEKEKVRLFADRWGGLVQDSPLTGLGVCALGGWTELS